MTLVELLEELLDYGRTPAPDPARAAALRAAVAGREAALFALVDALDGFAQAVATWEFGKAEMWAAVVFAVAHERKGLA